MPRSMTGFGRYFVEDGEFTQTWEIRSVNGRYLEFKWRLPQEARHLEASFEKLARRHCSRGRVEVSLNLRFPSGEAERCGLNREKAEAMLAALEDLAADNGHAYIPDYNALLCLGHLWEETPLEPDAGLGAILAAGLNLALEDWNESRKAEGLALERDLAGRILRMEEWTLDIEKRAPDLKTERAALLRERLGQALAEQGLELEEGRFLQEIVILADKIDVSEEITRLKTHLERLRELLKDSGDAGRRLDFTLQECFREVNTCGNKIQEAQLSRLVVELKNELEKCREQVQNIE